MYQGAVKVVQHAQRCTAHFPPFGMPAQQCQPGLAVDMDPMQRRPNASPRLIGMEYRRVLQSLTHRSQGGFCCGRGRLFPGQKTGFGDWLPRDRGQHFGGPVHWYQVLHLQIYG